MISGHFSNGPGFQEMQSGFVCFVSFDSLRPSQQFSSYVGTGLSGLNQY